MGGAGEALLELLSPEYRRSGVPGEVDVAGEEARFAEALPPRELLLEFARLATEEEDEPG
jgi:hypothetical protein